MNLDRLPLSTIKNIETDMLNIITDYKNKIKNRMYFLDNKHTIYAMDKQYLRLQQEYASMLLEYGQLRKYYDSGYVLSILSVELS